MNRIQETSECGRGEQLVAYLYGETGERERADFEGHLAACAACRAELSAFAQVREAVGE
ncbi:MAG: zf-HC2 domain-containing protein, partial [Acidobacteriota bacterium]|nr:zf-HC2 domain-containing protein [Acidobacteriota bacterium]